MKVNDLILAPVLGQAPTRAVQAAVAPGADPGRVARRGPAARTRAAT